MFDLDRFLDDCRNAVREDQPQLAVRDVLTRAVRSPHDVAEVLPPVRAELVPLLVADDLTVLKVVWAPGMRIQPHNHLMWAAIGLYGGQEDNTFYRRSENGLTVSGGRELTTGDVAVLGDDVVHAIANPRTTFAGAIHVYGGDLTHRQGRSEWDESGTEVEADFARTRRMFDEVNARLAATGDPDRD
jgi:predicted metal-dependent enzyme (double-stranded beta helix superfamily)